MRESSHSLDRLSVTFDDDHAVAHAGLIAPATLAQHLGLKELFDERVDLGSASGHANVGVKAMTLVHSAIAGGDCIDDAAALSVARTAEVLGHDLRAPSTLGTFLRSFTWGHVAQLDAVLAEALRRAYRAGAGPSGGPITIDVDSSICEVYGRKKQGARYGHTKVRGYHPLIATLAETGDVVGFRLRSGNAHTGRGAPGFLSAVLARLSRAGLDGPFVLRADSGFYNSMVTATCRSHDVRYSITVKMSPALRAVIEAIKQEDWTPIPYWIDGGADVAETTWRPFSSNKAKKNRHPEVRLIVRRVRPSPGSQLALFAIYDYHALITDRDGTTSELEADHRRHAVTEDVIRELKYGVGLNHLPSGRFSANAAWAAFNVLAHNLCRWTARIGLPRLAPPMTLKTMRRRLFDLPGRLTTRSRRQQLRLQRRWPWETELLAILEALRAIPQTPGVART